MLLHLSFLLTHVLFHIRQWCSFNQHIAPELCLLLQGVFPVSLQECRVRTMGTSGAVCLPSPLWMPPTLRQCPSLPHTCLYHLQSARPSLTSAAPSVSLWHSTCSSSPFCGSLSWTWVSGSVSTRKTWGSECCRLIWAICSVLLQISSSIKDSLEHEVVHYDFKSSFFDIFVSIQVCLHWFSSRIGVLCWYAVIKKPY